MGRSQQTTTSNKKISFLLLFDFKVHSTEEGRIELRGRYKIVRINYLILSCSLSNTTPYARAIRASVALPCSLLGLRYNVFIIISIVIILFFFFFFYAPLFPLLSTCTTFILLIPSSFFVYFNCCSFYYYVVVVYYSIIIIIISSYTTAFV